MSLARPLGWIPNNTHTLVDTLRFSLALKLTFACSDKIIEMYERWGANRLLEDRAAVEHGIEIGRGAIWLRLTSEQYGKLKRPLGWR
jgi:hypothetical protein